VFTFHNYYLHLQRKELSENDSGLFPVPLFPSLFTFIHVGQPFSFDLCMCGDILRDISGFHFLQIAVFYDILFCKEMYSMLDLLSAFGTSYNTMNTYDLAKIQIAWLHTYTNK
jgi:hypothetical protein